MTTQETIVTERVFEILREQLGNEVTLSPESDLLRDLGVVSLELVELGLILEKDFSINIPVADLRLCLAVEEVIQLVLHIASQKVVKSV